MANFKEGGDVTNAAKNIAAGGLPDAGAVGVGGAEILGSQGGTGAGFGGITDSSASNINVQEGYAGGTTDNTVDSGNVGPIST